CGAAQHGATLGDPHDPGERALVPRGVADDVHLVADDDAPATQLAGLHRGDATGAVCVAVGGHAQGVAAAVDARDEAAFGVGVLGALLRARSRAAPAGPVPDVALVEAARRHRPSIPCHWTVKSGKVFAV